MANAVTEFLESEGLKKEARRPMPPRGGGGFLRQFGQDFSQTMRGGGGRMSLGRAAGAAAGLIATTAGTMLASEAIQAGVNAVKRARGYQQMLRFNPKIVDRVKGDGKQLRATYNTLYKASPSIASDPLMASAWVNRVHGMEEYLDPKLMADLASAEYKIRERGRTRIPELSGQLVGKMLGGARD